MTATHGNITALDLRNMTTDELERMPASPQYPREAHPRRAPPARRTRRGADRPEGSGAVDMTTTEAIGALADMFTPTEWRQAQQVAADEDERQICFAMRRIAEARAERNAYHERMQALQAERAMHRGKGWR